MFATRTNRTSRPVSQAPRQSKPTFEMLEERQHFSVYTVTNTNDSGTGSLRAAIQAVNAGKDNVVKFNIPKSSHGYSSSTKSWTITPLSPLPVMDKTVMIDGYSQPGYSNSPVVKINGQGLEFAAPHSTLRGMEVENADDGVTLDPTSYSDVVVGNTITGSVYEGLGVNSNNNTIGAVGHANLILNTLGGGGLGISGDGNTVIGNTISGANVTVDIDGNGNTLQANKVSDSYDGADIWINGGGNLIGGYSSGDGNVINGYYTGIDLNSNPNIIVGNSITMQPGGVGIAQAQGQGAPVINSATEYLGKLTVTGTLIADPFTEVRVELFASTPQTSSAQPANNEGEVFLGFVDVSSGFSGTATFSDTLAYNGVGKVITATATNLDLYASSGFSNAETTFLRFPILRLPIHLI